MSILRYETEVYAYLSTASVYGGIAYLAGLTSEDLSLDVAGQTTETLANVEHVLALVGSDKSRLLRTEVWIADMAHFETMNEVYCAWLDPDNVPARVCTQAQLWDDRCLIEIMATATVAT